MAAAPIPTNIVSMAALAKDGPFQRYEYPVKPLAQRDVDFHVTYCGVCHTDLHMLHNDWGMSRFPLVPGHEVVGHVIAVGSAVTEFQVGDVVGLGCLAQKCDKCDWCVKGHDNVCKKGKFTYFGTTVDETGEHVHHGGFSSFLRTDAGGFFKIPKGYSEAHAGPLMCAGLTVSTPLYEYCNNSFDGRGKRVGIQGIGGLGHLAIQFARKMNFDKVVAISRTDEKKAFALELGATDYIATSNAAEMQANAETLDYILVCQSGGNFDLFPYLALLRPYGRLHFVGVPEGPLAFPVQALLFRNLAISASGIGGCNNMRQMLDFAATHDIKPIIEVFPHSQVNEAVEKVANNSIRFRAVLKNDLA